MKLLIKIKIVVILVMAATTLNILNLLAFLLMLGWVIISNLQLQ